MLSSGMANSIEAKDQFGLDLGVVCLYVRRILENGQAASGTLYREARDPASQSLVRRQESLRNEFD